MELAARWTDDRVSNLILMFSCDSVADFLRAHGNAGSDQGLKPLDEDVLFHCLLEVGHGHRCAASAMITA